MKVQKAYIKDDDTTVIKCPECKTVRTISVGNYKDDKKVLKIKCSCKTVFGISLEARKVFRKECHLYGTCINLSRKNMRDDIIVQDISMNGVGFTVMSGNHSLVVDDEIRVEFKLDDPQKSQINRNATVKIVKDNFIGSEFNDHHQYNKAIGFYLMPN